MPIHTLRPSDSEGSGQLLFGLPPPSPDLEQRPEGISLCMIVKNEERFLESCLRSVEGIVDEICIVDTGSTDRTIEIAQQFGAKLEYREWRSDFGWARNVSLRMATKRWTLVLDADEEIAPESRRALLDLRTVPADLSVLYCRIHNDIDEHGASAIMSHSLPRIFPTNDRITYKGVIHESLCVDDGKTRASAVVTPIRILHKGYRLEMLQGRHKNERNAPLLLRATEIDENDSFAWFNYGNHLLGSDRWEEGIVALERMVELERDNEMRGFVPLGHVTLASAYAVERRDFDKAIETIDRCLKNTPDYVLATYAKGEILARAERFDEAREWYQKAIESKTREDRYLVVDEEIAVWKAQFNIATTYLNEGRVEESIPWLETARKNKPDIWSVYERLAWVFERVKRFFDAEIVLREGFARFGSEAASASYVNYLVRRQRFTRALEVIEEALPGSNDQAKVALYVAAAAIVEKRGGDPLEYLKSALAINPASGYALGMLDALYLARGDELSRARLLREEMEAPLVAAADFGRRSNRLIEEHRLEEAARVAEEGLVLSPTDGTLLFNLALALAQLEGETERAIEVLGRLSNATGEVRETGGFLRASLLEREERIDEALGALEAVFGAAPSQEDALLLRARLLEKLGRMGDAETGLREAMGPGRKRVGVELAAMMMRSGRLDEARGIAIQALAAG